MGCKKLLTVSCKKVLTVPCKKLLTMWLQNHLTTHTSVIDPYGNIVQGAAGDGETYIRAVLEKDKIRETRETLQWESLKLPDIYKKYEQYRFRDV